ncbi:hypothetical protein M3J09_004244 [Ascochyta lentis]
MHSHQLAKARVKAWTNKHPSATSSLAALATGTASALATYTLGFQPNGVRPNSYLLLARLCLPLP